MRLNAVYMYFENSASVLRMFAMLSSVVIGIYVSGGLLLHAQRLQMGFVVGCGQ